MKNGDLAIPILIFSEQNYFTSPAGGVVPSVGGIAGSTGGTAPSIGAAGGASITGGASADFLAALGATVQHCESRNNSQKCENAFHEDSFV